MLPFEFFSLNSEGDKLSTWPFFFKGKFQLQCGIGAMARLAQTMGTTHWFFKQEADWMIYLTCVVRGQLDPVFSFKDEHKSEQDFKIKYNMYR